MTRRKLNFTELDDVVRDVESLRAGSYERAGNWDLAQVCSHLADWMSFPLDGFPRPPAPVRAVFWVLRNTFAPGRLRKTLATGEMPAGVPTLRETVGPAGGDEGAAVERLSATIDRFKSRRDPLHPSPMFGRVDYETALRMQLVHCSHHLSFLVPKAS